MNPGGAAIDMLPPDRIVRQVGQELRLSALPKHLAKTAYNPGGNRQAVGIPVIHPDGHAGEQAPAFGALVTVGDERISTEVLEPRAHAPYGTWIAEVISDLADEQASPLARAIFRPIPEIPADEPRQRTTSTVVHHQHRPLRQT